MSILQKLTEGVQSRDLRAEGAALLNKWEATGLLEGLNDGQAKQGMAVLLENQAKELLREASAMAAGDVEGFAAVAFPIVRRVFGGLIANDLVSVQPMSLPSGLIFFLDFQHSDTRGGAIDGNSIYGGNVVGRQLTGGVSLADPLTSDNDAGAGGHYNFGNQFAQATGSASVTLANPAAGAVQFALDGSVSEANKKLIRYDPDLLALTDSTQVEQYIFDAPARLDTGALAGLVLPTLAAGDTLVRRLTSHSPTTGKVTVTIVADDGGVAAGTGARRADFPVKDQFEPGGEAGSVTHGLFGLEEPVPAGGSDGGAKASGAAGGTTPIAEIDIKVDSIAVTAQTKKLKAKWTPELGQDLNAYHNLDAEVELTGILSEQIALEIDRELLSELVEGATAGTRYWSRAPGLFVNSTGAEIGASSAAPDFTGTVSEWYETLIETINDVSAQIHRKTLRGGANFVVCSPEIANILEFTSGFRASVTADQDRGTIGAVKAGALSKKFDVYVDPYFLRNVLLVGRKGTSFLESGYVYAPYVPLQVTPTIFGTEDFVPRKGVMTRYAKKMVRPDMYGLVIVRGLLGEAGATS
jgi:hypothetical protein